MPNRMPADDQVECPSCHKMNPQGAIECEQCKADLTQLSAARSTNTAVPKSGEKGFRRWLPAVLIVVAVLALIFGCIICANAYGSWQSAQSVQDGSSLFQEVNEVQATETPAPTPETAQTWSIDALPRIELSARPGDSLELVDECSEKHILTIPPDLQPGEYVKTVGEGDCAKTYVIQY